MESSAHRIPAPAENSAEFRPLSVGQKLVKTLLGTGLFLIWLLLFILGLSLDANDYRPCVAPADTVSFHYLTLYAVSFTPINVALLASLAGALGGIASNLAASNKFSLVQPSKINSHSEDFQSYLYMTENPLVSLLRGFVTFMIFIAGSYLTDFTSANDPGNAGGFSGITASSYLRFSVSVSLLAYLAGYDPSRIQNLLNKLNLSKKENDLYPVERETVTQTLQVEKAGHPINHGQP
ncbi:hypothetical protein M0L20_18280 [Spirosoma sp. RP8]|uniref:Uncharacterized protein n=1 Tax=Spirosoma liriopis TaxID=2937440 RepID=A0ABT0HQI5_9BACT|nr:hypothetical protein [Spirosoma liriopis]MCK8493820.1 hypothetical protein [Spirosoma liriopis]